ncbi:hypothetical protein [Catenuloplanes japonicus]|uniref:hypothetical protein n=1 Tax=Catenuloplanes japonicus TaxID=33876 RepID=UPI0005264E99|nr:hypothetical protein [Catenuloplanes japonicus]
MTPVFQFRMVVDTPPTEAQAVALVALPDSPAVEIAPEEQTGVVWFDRSASLLAEALVTAARDLERVGLRPIRVEPRDPVTIPEAAARLGRSAEWFRDWLAGTRGEPGAPKPLPMRVTGPEKLFSWDDLTEWVRERLDPGLPDDPPVLNAAGLVLRLRRCASGVDGLPVLLGLIAIEQLP